MRSHRLAAGVLWLMLMATSAVAQDLDPRAYAKVPVGLTLAIAGLSFSSGGVLTDPTLPVDNVHADVWTPSIGVAKSFSLFGRTAQALAALPYSWAHVTGDVGEQAQHVDRSGLSDMRLRLSVLLAGAPAMTPQQFAKSPRRPIVGVSVMVAAPTGQYDPRHVINLGTNRWGFKPEVALSYPLGRRWLVDAYAGLWMFTSNGAFYPGAVVRTQAPIGSLQAHVSYSLSPKAWAAFDATWYAGGAGVGERRPQGGFRIELARRRDGGSSGREPALDQGRVQYRRDCPLRRQLHDRVSRLADGMAQPAAGAEAAGEMRVAKSPRGRACKRRVSAIPRRK